MGKTVIDIEKYKGWNFFLDMVTQFCYIFTKRV